MHLSNFSRPALNIQDKLEEKHRCWRVKYQDSLKFHMDIVPGIPEIQERQRVLIERMIRTGTGEPFANEIAKHAMSITDNRHPNYQQISLDWQISNQEGYALWFQSRMRLAQTLLESRAKAAMVAKIDNLPAYRWKTPLQRCIQILKRHRDIMFEGNSEIKPISAIITTLAARAYNGETELDTALTKILFDMGSLVSRSDPRVPNPVNTQEDFADKWPKDPRLEKSFWTWLTNAKETFSSLEQSKNKALVEIGNKQFGVMLDEAELCKYDALMEKAGAISSGFAYTHKNGSIGNNGIKNQPHKFYGEE